MTSCTCCVRSRKSVGPDLAGDELLDRSSLLDDEDLVRVAERRGHVYGPLEVTDLRQRNPAVALDVVAGTEGVVVTPPFPVPDRVDVAAGRPTVRTPFIPSAAWPGTVQR